MEDLLVRYADVFSQRSEDVGHTTLVQHEISLLPEAQPIRQPPNRVEHEKEAEIERQVLALEKQGMIEPAHGAWSSPVVLVKKKNEAWRLCVDYRKLNSVTCQDAYPLPRIDESLDALSGSKFFSTLDMISEYWQTQVKYLGHVISNTGVATDPEKIQAISKWAAPQDVTQLRSYLGTTGYYHRYVADYASITKPLTLLTSEGAPWKWGEDEQEAFLKLKWSLTHAPVLAYPDLSLPYVLDTDASNVGTGAVLSQVQQGKERPIAYYSKTLSPPNATTASCLLGLAAPEKGTLLPGGPVAGEPSRAQCAAIEKRDRGPTRSQVCDSLVPPGTNWETTVPVDQVSVQPPRGTGGPSPSAHQLDEDEWPRLPSSRHTLGPSLMTPTPASLVPVRLPCNVGSPSMLDNPFRKSQDPRLWAIKVAGEPGLVVETDQVTVQSDSRAASLDSSPPDAPKVPELLTVVQTSLDKVRALQQRPATDLGIIYQAVRNRKSVEEAVLQVGSSELQRLARMFHQLQIDESGVLTLHLIQNGRERVVVVCPQTLRQEILWKAHEQTHCGVERTLKRVQTTPYHPEGNGVVERNNRVLGDSLRALLLGRGQGDWDQLLPQIMRTLRGLPHSATKKTPNYLMLGRKLRLPDQLLHGNRLESFTSTHEYVQTVHDRLIQAHTLLQDRQKEIVSTDVREPPLFNEGDLVWLISKRRRKGKNPKLVAKYVGPYRVTRSHENHTYEIERYGQRSIQAEGRLRLCRPSPVQQGRAPTEVEPARRPNMRGYPRKRVSQKDGNPDAVISDSLLPSRLIDLPIPQSPGRLEPPRLHNEDFFGLSE
ncbi:uncharacterized protein [Watersipora subatra]|uniref:uncharacterized protein n=1 Tax=Watersipora subatra TaxID=2589382 RepID=UPI00355C53A2